MSVQIYQWQSQLALAKNALISGDYLTADSCLTAAINFGHSENAPEDAVADIFYHRGICFESRQRYEDAKRSFNQSYHTFCRCLGPTSMQAVRAAKAKCLVEIKMGRSDDARLHFEKIAQQLIRELGDNDPEVIAIKTQISSLFSHAEPQAIPGTEVEIEPYMEVDSWHPTRRTVEMDVPRLPPEAALTLAKKGAVQAAVSGAIANQIQESVPQENLEKTDPPTARETASAALAAAAAAAKAAASTGGTTGNTRNTGSFGPGTSSSSLPASTLGPRTSSSSLPASSLGSDQPAPTSFQAPSAAAPHFSLPETAARPAAPLQPDVSLDEDWGPIPDSERLTDTSFDSSVPESSPDVKVRIVRSQPEAFSHEPTPAPDARKASDAPVSPPQFSIVTKPSTYPPERRSEPAVRPANQPERRVSELAKKDSLSSGGRPPLPPTAERKPVSADVTAKPPTTSQPMQKTLMAMDAATLPGHDSVAAPPAAATAKAPETPVDSKSKESPAETSASSPQPGPVAAQTEPPPQAAKSVSTPPAVPENKLPAINRFDSEELKHKVDLARTMMDQPKFNPLAEALHPVKARETKPATAEPRTTEAQPRAAEVLPTIPDLSPLPSIDSLPSEVKAAEPESKVSQSANEGNLLERDEKAESRPARKMLSGVPTVDLSKVTEFEQRLSEPDYLEDEGGTTLLNKSEKRPATVRIPKPTPTKPLVEHRQFIRPLEIEEFVHPRDRVYTMVAKVVAVIGYGLCALSGIGIPILIVAFVARWVMSGLQLGQLRGRGIKVSSTQFSEVYESLHHISAALGLPTAPETYVIHEHGMVNAMATRLHGSDIVVIYADVIELAYSFGEAELAFVIAHELSHIRGGHLQWAWVELPARLVPFLGKALSRAREYTCDRIAQELVPEGAAMGLVALAAGTKVYRRVNLKAMYEQQEAESSFWTWFAEILSTHPNLLNRIRALGLTPNSQQKPSPAPIGAANGH